MSPKEAAERAEKIMSQGRSDLIVSQVFWGQLALRLRLKAVNWLETGATDGTWLFYNPAFVLSLKTLEVIFFLAHEVMHCALMHPFRRGDRDPELWNIACDYAINLILRSANFTLPDDVLIDDRFAGMSAEEIYSILEKERRQQKGGQQGQGQGAGGQGGGQPQPQPKAKGKGARNAPDPGRWGGVIDPQHRDEKDGKAKQKLTPAELSEAETKWKVAVAQAEQLTRKAGLLGGVLERAIDKSEEGEVDWLSRLRDFMESQYPADYSYAKPNRYMLTQHNIVMPGIRRENSPPIVAVIDCSGSMQQKDLDVAASEVTEAASIMKPESVLVLYHDTVVKNHQEFSSGEELVFKAKGGGGTDFRPVFEWLEKNDVEPAFVLFFTDLYGPFPVEEPDYPVLWVTQTVEMEPPFGEKVLLLHDAA